MKKNTQIIFIFIIFFISYCKSDAPNNKTVKVDEITEQQVEVAGGGSRDAFIIRFSNLIYENYGKYIIIPIFQGVNGDALYSDFRHYCLNKKYLEPQVRESAFIIKCKPGEVRKTFHEFLRFYKSNILKDVNIESPENFRFMGEEWMAVYKFKQYGIPCYISVSVEATDKDINTPQKEFDKYTSVYQIKPKEDGSYPCLAFEIHVDSENTPW